MQVQHALTKINAYKYIYYDWCYSTNPLGAQSLVSIMMHIYMLDRIMYNRTQNHQYSCMCR